MEYENSDSWKVSFNTLSRDGAIKASTIIARAIDSERLTSQKTKIFILGGAGKSLIFDAMARYISDHHTAYKMPATRFVEGRPSKALGGKTARQIVKGIHHKNKSCVVTFCHLAGEHKKSWLENVLSKYFKCRNVGIDFSTEINDGFETSIPDISIKFHPEQSNELENGWGRRWKINIINPELQTEPIREALKQLASYEYRRKNRLAL